MKQLTLHDHQPVTLSLYDALVEGLSRDSKRIPPKFFYDARGSRLFDLICEQPEYYPPTVESAMLERLAGEIADLCGAGCVLIEPGAGSATKVRLLLEPLRPAAFVPMDISFDHLKAAAQQLCTDYPWLPVHAVCIDFTDSLPIPDSVPEGRRLLFFPGSSLGNFDRDEAAQFLRLVRLTIGEHGRLLIGVDTKKDTALLNAAYNDAAGVTAAFNLNLIHRMRRELSLDIDPAGFDHSAFYNEAAGRVEMHLVSRYRQRLRLGGQDILLAEGETLHTENSYKYAPDEFLQLSASVGLDPVDHWLDEDGMFGIYLLRPS